MINNSLILIIILVVCLGQSCQLHPAYLEQIDHDLEAFRDGITDEMIEKGRQIQNEVKDAFWNQGICLYEVKNSQITTNCSFFYNINMGECFLKDLAKELPDVEFFINNRDDPRVLKYPCKEKPLHPNNTCYCDPGFKIPNHGFFIQPKNWRPTEDLIPIFSASTIPQCFLDILFPSPFIINITQSKFLQQKDIYPWPQKKFKLFWRGAITDGKFVKVNDKIFREGHRVRLLKLCKQIKECDAKYHGPLDQPPAVVKHFKRNHYYDESYQSLKDYNINKILIDIQGLSYSQRFGKLLQTGSVVFKISVFTSLINLIPKPWEHFVPISINLDDFEEKVEWARNNDDEIRKIGQRGRQLSKKIHNYQTYMCYAKTLIWKYYKLRLKGKKKSTINKLGEKSID